MPDEEYRLAFAARLKELREARGWSRRELARACEVEVWEVDGWEGSHLLPSLEDIASLADALECSMDYLAGRSDCDGRIGPSTQDAIVE